MSVTIRGLQEFLAKLKRLQGSQFSVAMRDATQEAVLYVYSTVPTYPPPPAGSSYRRTGTLGRSITTEVKAIGTRQVGSIGTNVVYAPYVIDKERQAGMHVGRWWTLQDVVLKARDKVIDIYIKAVRRLWAS